MRSARLHGGRKREAHLDALMSHEWSAGASMLSATPIPPEQWGRTNGERMEQHADLARFGCGAAVPLTRLAQWTRTTPANAGSIHHTHTAIDLSALLMRNPRAPSRAPHGSIGLEREV